MSDRNNTYKVNIEHGKFDFHVFFENCENYCRRKGMSVKEIRAIQLLIEEVIVNHLLKYSEDISFEITCIDEKRYADIKFTYIGDEYNMFEREDQKDLSMVLINCLTGDFTYEYHEAERKNKMIIIVQF